MPRPSGKAQRIAEKVIPGLQRGSKKSRRGVADRGSMSEVEIKETENIESRKGLRQKGPYQGKI